MEKHVSHQTIAIWFISSDPAVPNAVPFKDFMCNLDVDSMIKHDAHLSRGP